MQKTVGKRLKEARNDAGLSGKELGAYINVSKGQISNIENGSSDLTKSNAIVLANVLGVSVDWLLYGKGEMGGSSSSGQYASAGRDIGVQAGRDVTQHGQASKSDCEKDLEAANREIERLEKYIARLERMLDMDQDSSIK